MKNKHFKSNVLFVLVICSMLITGCSRFKGGIAGNEYRLVGSQIPAHDRQAGVTQASPGIEKNQMTDGMLTVADTTSLLRFKINDDPVPNAETNGLLKAVAVTKDIHSAVSGLGLRIHDDDDVTIELNVEKIMVKEHKEKEKKKPREKEKIITYSPSGDEGKISFNHKRIYTQLTKGISMAAGMYEWLSVSFKRDGKLYYKNKVYTVHLGEREIVYPKGFTVEKGKITTLSLISIKDRFEDIFKHGNRGERLESRHHHRSIFMKTGMVLGLSLRQFLPLDETQNDPVMQAYIKFKSLSAVNEAGESIILNDQLTEFELLSLRNGAVALMGNNAVEAGEYEYFDLELEGNNYVIVNGSKYPLEIQEWAYDSVRFMGPFDLRGGRISEVFVNFDPNSSFIYIRGKGYILEPDIVVSAIVSLTPKQELRLVESLGARSNEVMGKAELAFEGWIKTVVPVLGQNIYGKNMIYSDVSLEVLDRLRGEVDLSAEYKLRMIGGSYNGINLRVPGMPQFTADEDVLLFLKEYNGRMSTVMGEYGKINIQ